MTDSRNIRPSFDVSAVRQHFPALRDGAAHFDGPGGTQTPDVVAQAIYDTLTKPLANRGSRTQAERNAEEVVQQCRSAVGDLIGAEPGSLIFGRSSTQNTFDMARCLANRWGPGDEVLVTRLDHDSNVRPWMIAAERVGATVRLIDFDPETGELDPSQVERMLSSSTRLVAVTAASNLIGTMPDVPAIAEMVHAVGALLYVDGVHYTAHAPVDVRALGADFFACSPYKFLGPHCGVLHGRPEVLQELTADKLLPAPNTVPEKFERGTLPYELMAGTTAAVDFLAGMASGHLQAGSSRRARLRASMTTLEAHEDQLRDRIEAALRDLPGVTLHSRASRRTSTLLVTFADHDAHDVSRHLADQGVNAPAGAFYAQGASERLGLGGAGGLRIGLAPYTDDSDVERLVRGLSGYFRL